MKAGQKAPTGPVAGVDGAFVANKASYACAIFCEPEGRSGVLQDTISEAGAERCWNQSVCTGQAES